MLPVTIWMNMPSFYQDDLFRALADRVDLRVVYDHLLTPERRQLGWAEGSNGYQFRVLDAHRKMREAAHIAFSERGRLHVVNGIWAEPAFAAAALVLGMTRAHFAVYAEAPNDQTSRSAARRAVRSSFGGWVAGRACGLLAVSHFAAEYYSGVGFTAEQIYPFGYFRNSSPARASISSGKNIEVVFVGQLVHRKGIDILMASATPVLKENSRVRISLIGAGADKESIAADLNAAGIADRVVFEGVLSPAEMHERLAHADLLVLPSRWDGWGLVVNEALSAGIPVIASDRCGAAELICHGVNGYVFRSEDVADLRACLRAFLSADHKQMRAAAVQTSSALTIPVVADYLVACLEHMTGSRLERPTAPWESVVAEMRCGRPAATMATR